MKTSELIDDALDWAVAKAEGHNVVILTREEQRARWFQDVKPEDMAKEAADYEEHIWPTIKPKLCILSEDNYKRGPYHNEALMAYGAGIAKFEYSTSWPQGGPIIEREGLRVGLCYPQPSWATEATWSASTPGGNGKLLYGPTPLIAAMRCFVASKLGDEVDVPEELR